MERGLAGEPSSLKMLPSFVPQPRGDERGRVAVVDWGGTRGRVALMELAGHGLVRPLAEDALRFGEGDKAAPAAHVFDAIAGALARVVGTAAPADGAVAWPLGFVYSYPARLERIDRAIALSLTKGWKVRGLVGQDVATLLGDALRRRGLGRVKVAAVANDTVAALAVASFRARGDDRSARPADIGLIVGTGTNQAADVPGAGIRNLESGNFDEISSVATAWDEALDRELAEPAPGAQRFEKMAAGHYLGEILRRAIRDVGRSSPLFRWRPEILDAPFALDGVHVSAIGGDASDDRRDIDAVLRAFGVESTLVERRALGRLAGAVARRSARLIAAGLVGTLTYVDPDLEAEHLVGVDGGLYGGYPGFAGMVAAGLEELVGAAPAARVRLDYVRDSTRAGAAIIAAGRS